MGMKGGRGIEGGEEGFGVWMEFCWELVFGMVWSFGVELFWSWL